VVHDQAGPADLLVRAHSIKDHNVITEGVYPLIGVISLYSIAHLGGDFLTQLG